MDMIPTGVHQALVEAGLNVHADASRWARDQYPANWPVQSFDEHVIELIRRATTDEGEAFPALLDRLPGQAYLLVPANGRQVPIGPDAPDLDAVIRSAAPRQAYCDYCQAWATVAALLPVSGSACVVALALCAGCTGHLDKAYRPTLHLILPTPTPDTTEEASNG